MDAVILTRFPQRVQEQFERKNAPPWTQSHPSLTLDRGAVAKNQERRFQKREVQCEEAKSKHSTRVDAKTITPGEEVTRMMTIFERFHTNVIRNGG